MREPNHFEKTELIEPITAVAISPQILRLTKTIVEESSLYDRHEQGGFFGGVVRNRTYFLWDNRQTATGSDGECVFYDQRRLFREIDIDFQNRRMQAMPDFKTVRYHSHPKVTEQTLTAELGAEASILVDHVKIEFEAGIFSSLGITTLDDAINEALSRHLSQRDLDANTGRYHLLISPTVYEQRPRSHLNFYDLQSGRLVPIRLASERELKPFLRTEERVIKEWKVANFGHYDFDQLTKAQLEAAHIKVRHPKMVEE